MCIAWRWWMSTRGRLITARLPLATSSRKILAMSRFKGSLARLYNGSRCLKPLLASRDLANVFERLGRPSSHRT